MRLGLFALAIILHYVPSFLPNVFCLMQFQFMLVYFMLGVVCCDWKQKISFVSRIPSWGILGCFVLVEGLKMMYMGGQVSELLPYLGIAAVMEVSVLLEKWNLKGNGWLMTISYSSYIVYLFHTTFEGFAKAMVHKIPFFTNGNEILFVINVLVVVSCGVVCPIVLHRYVLSRTHITRVLFGLK